MIDGIPDTLSFPPRNQLNFPLLSSQSRTRWNVFTQRSLSAAADPQNRSGSVTESRYRSRWDSLDSSELQVPGGGGREDRHLCVSGAVRVRPGAGVLQRLKMVQKRVLVPVVL